MASVNPAPPGSRREDTQSTHNQFRSATKIHPHLIAPNITFPSPLIYKKTGLSAQVGRPGNKLFHGTASRRFQRLPHLQDHLTPALIDRCQLLRLGSARDSSLLNRLGSRSRINSIEDGGTYKDGEKEGDYIHTYAKEQRLPATDCIEG
jgi:hypothetical protein